MSLAIVTRRGWGAKYPSSTLAPLPASELYLHHTVTARPSAASEVSAVRQLEEIGHQRFGETVSYTFLSMPSGMIYEGHDVRYRGTHTKGHNSIARAIALVGDYSTQGPTPAQVQAIGELIAHGRRSGWWTRASLNGGHRDLAQTACPGTAGYQAIGAINLAAAKALDPPDPTPTPVEVDVAFIKVAGDNKVWATDSLTRRHVTDQAELADLRKAGFTSPVVEVRPETLAAIKVTP